MRFLLLVALGTLAACAATPKVDAPGTDPLVLDAHAQPWHGGRVLLVREYTELYKEDGQDRRRQVQYLWDYSRSIAVRRVLSLDGEELLRNDEPYLTLRATEEETAAAFHRVGQHPDLKRSASVREAQWYGGFAYREPGDPYCGLESRCIHVVVTVDGGLRRIIHAIVDLQKDRVVYPFYDPAKVRPVTPDDPYTPEAP